MWCAWATFFRTSSYFKLHVKKRRTKKNEKKKHCTHQKKKQKVSWYDNKLCSFKLPGLQTGN